MTYIANRSNGKLFYNCKGKRQHGTEFCKSRNFKEEEFEKLFTDVRDEIYELQQGKLNKYVWNCLEVVREDIEHQIDNDHSEEIKELNNIIQNRKSEIKRLLRITAKSNIDFDTYAEQLTEYQNEINESKMKLEELKPERLKEKMIGSITVSVLQQTQRIISRVLMILFQQQKKPFFDMMKTGNRIWTSHLII